MALEFVPWSVIGNLEAAIDVVERADCANGGLLLDSWHWARGGARWTRPTRSSPRASSHVQLSDAPAAPAADLWHETLPERLLPGAGTIDIARLVAALERRGVACPLAAKVFSDRLVAAGSGTGCTRTGREPGGLFPPKPAREPDVPSP